MEQIKHAFASLKEYWKKLSAANKRIIAGCAGGILALAVIATIFLNFNGNEYIVLYDGLERSESAEVYAALEELSIPARMTNGNVEVRKDSAEYARAQLAMQNIPKTTLSYDIFSSGGLTTTDYEKRQLAVQQLQNRLQDTIRQYDGIKNAFVTLSIAQESNRVWETTPARSTGSVSVVLQPGYSLSRDQVSGIKYLVASSVGSTMTVSDVKVIDAATSLSLKSREDTDISEAESGLERLGFEQRIEERLVEKALHSLSLFYDEEDIRASATVVIDYNKMITESKQYKPSEDSTNNSGVLQHSEDAYVSDGQAIVGGIVGEENNTDTPVYVDQDGDGRIDYINNARSRDYAVSYITQQIEKDQAELVNATIAITIKGQLDDISRASIIETVSRATNIEEPKISVQNFVIENDTPVVPANTTAKKVDPVVVLIFATVAVLLIIILIIVIVMLNKKKKRKLAAAKAAAEAEAKARAEKEAFDAEAHKRALIEGAERSRQEDLITNEIRDFAHENPEITANILRTWLREDDD